MRPSDRSIRGAALLETALVVPPLLLVTLYGLSLGELVHVKLQVQQAARFAAWEATARTLSDPLGGHPQAAFAHARGAIERDTRTRFARVASRADALPSARILEVSSPAITISSAQVDSVAPPRVPVPAEAPGLAALAAASSLEPVETFLRRAGFDLEGEVRADARADVRSLLAGLPALDRLTLSQHVSLIADGWALQDGADARVAQGRAGAHASGTRSLLHAQVSRLVFAGGVAAVGGGVLPALPQGLPLPSLTGTFVVSHNYGPLRGRSACPGIPGYPSGVGAPDARAGLSDQRALADHERPVCFDTAPFRDTEAYADSLYAQLFAARGAYFLGCRNAQAEDPAQPEDVDLTDRSTLKVHCGDAP